MKVTLELTENLIPILSKEQLQEALKQSLQSNSPKTFDSTDTCVPIDSAASQKGNYSHSEDVIITTATINDTNDSKPKINKFRNTMVIANEIIEKCAEDFKKGMTITNICKKYNLKYTTVYGRLQKLGLIIKKK